MFSWCGTQTSNLKLRQCELIKEQTVKMSTIVLEPSPIKHEGFGAEFKGQIFLGRGKLSAQGHSCCYLIFNV